MFPNAGHFRCYVGFLFEIDILSAFIKVARRLIEKSKQSLTSPKRLSPKKRTRTDWTRQEDSALVQFIALHCDIAETSKPSNKNQWPSTKKNEYWKKASKFVAEASFSAVNRAGRLILRTFSLQIFS